MGYSDNPQYYASMGQLLAEIGAEVLKEGSDPTVVFDEAVELIASLLQEHNPHYERGIFYMHVYQDKDKAVAMLAQYKDLQARLATM